MRTIKGKEKMLRDQLQDYHKAIPKKGRPTYDSLTRQRYRAIQLMESQMVLAQVKIERVVAGLGSHGRNHK